MGISVDQMILDLRDNLGVDDDDLSDAKALLFLNRAFWEILNKFPFREKEKQYTFNTVIGTADYTVPTLFEAIRSISILNPDSLQYSDLERMDPRVYYQEFDTSPNSYGYPLKYFREDNKIKIFPSPNLAYSLLVRYWINLSDLETGTDEPVIPEVWHEIIELGAEYRAWRSFRSYKSAQDARLNQLALINSTVPVEAKEEGDSRFAGLSSPFYNRQRLYK